MAAERRGENGFESGFNFDEVGADGGGIIKDKQELVDDP